MQTTSPKPHVFDPASLVDGETGELDLIAIRNRAALLASRDYGAPNYPPNYFRSHELNVTEIARIMRKRWRAAHGLPDDTVYELMQVPAWGCSGDSFSPARGGI